MTPVLLAVNDFPPVPGGESTLYHALARGLARGEAVVLAPRGPDDAAIDAGLAVEVIRRALPDHGGTVRRVLRGLAVLVHLTALLARRRFDYLVCGQLLSIGIPMWLLTRLTRRPYAVVVHGADLADASRAPWRAWSRRILAGAHTVIANSRFTAALVDRLHPGAARRLLVLPMGVDPAPSPDPSRVAVLRDRYRLGTPVLLSVARLIPMKGHDVVIEALPLLLETFPDLVYLVVGHGPHRGTLERLARDRGVADRVRFAGYVPASDLAAHYALATLFVQLSRESGVYDGLEGFGLTFLEAASHGVPSLAGDSGGVREAVADGRSGLLLPPRDPQAFAAAARRLLSNADERRRLSHAALAWAAAHPWSASVACVRSLRSGAADARRAPARRSA